MFLPDNNWRNQPLSHGLYFWSVIWEGEVKLSEECDQECVDPSDAVGNEQPAGQCARFRLVFGRPLTRIAIQYNSCDLQRRWRYIKNLSLRYRGVDLESYHTQVTVNPDPGFTPFVGFEPPLRPEFMSVRSPHVLVPEDDSMSLNSVGRCGSRE